MKREKKSIKWRIFGDLLLFTLLLIVLLWFFQIVYLESFYRSVRTRDVKKALVEVSEVPLDQADAEDKINEIAKKKDLSILIMDQEGKVFVSSEYMGTGRLRALSLQKRLEYYQMAKEQGGSARIVLEEVQERRSKEAGADPKAPEPPMPAEPGPRRERAKNVLYVQVQETGGMEQVILLDVMLTPVEADEFKIGQVVYNLVNNALNYTGEDQCVTVRQEVLETSVRIEVEDTGEGIREEDLPYIWDRYYKVDRIHRRAVSGTGLGLSIVKNILELHGAEFGVRCGKKKGSVFWFALQRAECGEEK